MDDYRRLVAPGRAAPRSVAKVTADQIQTKTQPPAAPRLTSLSPGAGCACKPPLAKLEALFATMGDVPAMGPASGDLLIGRFTEAADGHVAVTPHAVLPLVRVVHSLARLHGTQRHCGRYGRRLSFGHGSPVLVDSRRGRIRV